MRKFLLFIILLLAPASANAQWHEAVSDHFVIYADGDEAWVRDFAEQLERFDHGVRRLRNLSDPNVGANRVTIYLISSTQFSDIIDSRSVGGFYLPRARGSVAFLPRGTGSGLKPQQVLFHEYTHHVFAVAWSNLALPGWLSEGLAEFHASAEFRDDGSMVIGREPAYREWSLSTLDSAAVGQMLTTETATTGEEIYYSGGWLLTHFLTFDKSRQDQLGKYLVAINKGRSLTEAATDAFGPVNKLQADLSRYRRGTSLPAVIIPAADLPIGPVKVRSLTAGEAAIIPVRIRSEAGVTDKEAPGIFAQAREIASTYPDNAFVQRVLAEAAYDAEDYEAAKAAAERAIAADPRLAGGHAYKALALLAESKDEKDTHGATIGDVRQAIETGLAAAPNDPELLWLSYRSYAEVSGAIPPLAKARLLQAYVIAPQAASLRIAAVHQLLLDHRAEEARSVIRPLAFSVEQSGLSKRARATLDKIEAGDFDGATSASVSASDDDDDEDNPAAASPAWPGLLSAAQVGWNGLGL